MPRRRASGLVAAGALLAVCLLAGCSAGEDDQGAAGTHLGRLRADEGRIETASGRAVQLRGVNAFAMDEQLEPLPQADFDRMADAGFNVVRLVAYWNVFEPEPPSDGRPSYEPRAFEALDVAVKRASRAGLYVVVDPVHLYKVSPAFGGYGVPSWLVEGFDEHAASTALLDDDRLRRHLREFLARIAERYADSAAVAGIDAVNEPPLERPDQIVELYADLIPAIRRAAPETLVLVEPIFGNSDLSRVDLTDLPGRDWVVLSPHFYFGGGEGTGYGPDGRLDGSYVGDSYTGYEGDRDDLKRHFEITLEAARRADLPVWVGEFGIGRDAHDAARWVDDALAVLGEADVGWAYWIHASSDPFSLTGEDGRYAPLADKLSAAIRGD